MASADKVTVNILGRAYDIESEGITALEMHNLAERLTDKLTEAQKKTQIVDTSRLAVLVAFNLIEELTRMQRKETEISGSCMNTLRQIEGILDDALASPTDSKE
ncbi:cell division protein ZapA [Elusimicrobiota bacterium]